MRIGKISSILAPGHGFCQSCFTNWRFVTPHETPHSGDQKIIALCEKCWSEIDAPARLLFYREIWNKWQSWAGTMRAQDPSYCLVHWAEIKRAVLQEGRPAYRAPEKITLHIERSGSGLYFVTSPDPRGLLVAERSFEEAIAAVPQALAALSEAAERDRKCG